MMCVRAKECQRQSIASHSVDDVPPIDGVDSTAIRSVDDVIDGRDHTAIHRVDDEGAQNHGVEIVDTECNSKGTASHSADDVHSQDGT